MSRISAKVFSVIISVSTLLEVLFSTVAILASLPRLFKSSSVSFLFSSIAFLLGIVPHLLHVPAGSPAVGLVDPGRAITGKIPCLILLDLIDLPQP